MSSKGTPGYIYRTPKPGDDNDGCGCGVIMNIIIGLVLILEIALGSVI
jgi:hypothetical protein